MHDFKALPQKNYDVRNKNSSPSIHIVMQNHETIISMNKNTPDDPQASQQINEYRDPSQNRVDRPPCVPEAPMLSGSKEPNAETVQIAGLFRVRGSDLLMPPFALSLGFRLWLEYHDVEVREEWEDRLNFENLFSWFHEPDCEHETLEQIIDHYALDEEYSYLHPCFRYIVRCGRLECEVPF